MFCAGSSVNILGNVRRTLHAIMERKDKLGFSPLCCRFLVMFYLGNKQKIKIRLHWSNSVLLELENYPRMTSLVRITRVCNTFT